jgi:outer membrane protein W
MRKGVVFCLMVLVLALSSGGAIRLGLSASYAKHLTSDFGGGLAPGFSLAYDLTPMFAVELRGVLFGSTVTGSATSLSQGKMTMMPLELAAVARFDAGKKIVPYAVLGGGYGLHSFTLDSTLVNAWSNVGLTLSESIKKGVTISLGGGLDFALNPGEKPGQGIFLNLEVRYLMAKSDGSSTLTDNASQEKAAATLTKLNLDSFLIGLGVKYGF